MEENAIATKSANLDEIDTSSVALFDGPTGYEGIDQECTIIPFLKIAQGGTDEAKKGNPKRIDGLEVGNFFCASTRKVYGDSVRLVILRFYRQYIIYESKDTDAKFMGVMAPEDFKKIEHQCTRERSYYLDAEGHRYVDTRNFIVFVHGHYEDGPMLLSLSSTGIKPSQKWLTQATGLYSPDGRQAPIWSSVWELNTGYFDNPLGGYYQIASVNRLGWIPAARKELVVKAFLDANAAATSEINESFKKDSASERNVTSESGSQADIVSNAFGATSMAKRPSPASAPDNGAPDIF